MNSYKTIPLSLSLPLQLSFLSFLHSGDGTQGVAQARQILYLERHLQPQAASLLLVYCSRSL